MSMNVKPLFVKYFDTEVKRAYGDIRALAGTVYTKSGVTGSSAYFSKKAKALATEHNRGAEVVSANIAFSRVECILKDIELFQYTDIFDSLKINFNEITEVAEVCGDGVGLAMDQHIIDAIETGTTQEVDSSAAAMDVDDLLDAKQLLDKKGVPSSDRKILVHAKQLTDLLKTTKVSSADYNSIKALVQGDLGTFCGFDFMTIAERQEGGLPSASTTLSALIYHKRAVGEAIAMDLKTSVDWVANRQAHLIGAKASQNAVVIDAEGTVRIKSLKA